MNNIKLIILIVLLSMLLTGCNTRNNYIFEGRTITVIKDYHMGTLDLKPTCIVGTDKGDIIIRNSICSSLETGLKIRRAIDVEINENCSKSCRDAFLQFAPYEWKKDSIGHAANHS